MPLEKDVPTQHSPVEEKIDNHAHGELGYHTAEVPLHHVDLSIEQGEILHRERQRDVY